MPSPFPGMDPYVEGSGHWPDFHSKLINVCHEQILERLPLAYDARVQEDVRLTGAAEGTGSSSKYVPDVLVSRDPGRPERRGTAGSTAGSTATLEPLTLRTPAYEEVRDEWIEIVAQPDRQLIAVVEVLSPANKQNPGFAQHHAKRAALVRNGVHVVDIDLLLAGRRPVLEPPLPDANYAALVFHGDIVRMCKAYLWDVRRPLPTLPVPLRGPAESINLDLADAFETTYRRGQYGRTIRYDRPPAVRLTDIDREWAVGVAARAAQPRTA